MALIVLCVPAQASCGHHSSKSLAEAVTRKGEWVAGPNASGSSIPSLDKLTQAIIDFPVPDWVDPIVFSQLKEELLGQLQLLSETGKGSGSDNTQATQVDDAKVSYAGDSRFSITWTYRNSGDYNLDGTVDIADIVALAEHFLEQASDSNYWIDGNSDGQIDIADVSTVAENFFNALSGYRIEATTDEVAWREIGFSSFVPPTGEVRPPVFELSFSLQDTQGMRFARVVPVDRYGNQMSPSGPVGIAPPELVITPSPTLGDAPLEVSFETVGTADPDGGAVTLTWDWDSDGSADKVSAPGESVSHIFSDPAKYEVSVSAVDDEGFPGSTSVSVSASSPQWVRTFGADGADQGWSIATDSSGAVYVVGRWVLTTGYQGIAVLKYAPDGALVWAKLWGPFDLVYSASSVYDLTSETLVVAGGAKTIWTEEQGTDIFAFLLRISADGALLLQKSWGDPSRSDVATDAEIDDVGNIYITGETSGFGLVGSRVFALKYNRDGDLLWSSILTSYLSADDNPGGVEIDPNGRPVFFVSLSEGSVGPIMVFTLNPADGVVESYRSISSEQFPFLQCHSSCISPDGKIYLGAFIMRAGMPFLVALSADYEVDWAQAVMGEAGMDRPYALAVSASGELYYGGESIPREGMERGFLMRILPPPSPGGYVNMWRWEFGEPQIPCRVSDFAFGADGKIYLTGASPDAYHSLENAEVLRNSIDLTVKEGFPRQYWPSGVETVLDLPFVDISGVEDTGGGYSDLLIMKLDPKNLP